MGKKKILLSSICILGMAVIFSKACMLEYKLGYIRDEYAITGEDGLLSFGSQLIILLLPLAVIIVNVIILFSRKIRKSLLAVVLILSICAMILSASVTVKVNLKMNEYPVRTVGTSEQHPVFTGV